MRPLLSSSLFVIALAISGAARADDADDGRRTFAEGTSKMKDGDVSGALDAFTESNRLLPSPNTTLLIARSLRALGRVEEAVERFEGTAADAAARVAAGEDKYQPTADAARAEAAQLRATLGVLIVRAKGATGGETVEASGRRRPLDDTRTAKLVHRPGSVRFVVRTSDGRTVEGTATLEAGRWTTVDVDLRGAPRPAAEVPQRPAPAEAEHAPRRWVWPAVIGAGAVSIVGFGAFAFFGLRTQSTFDSLETRCAPRCGPADQSETDRGAREQTFANVGLVVGAVALAATVGLVILRPKSVARHPAKAW